MLKYFMKQFTEILDSILSFRPMMMNLHITRHIPDEGFCAYSTIIKKKRSKNIVERINNAELDFKLAFPAVEQVSLY